MKDEISPKERAEIYETAWRAYCATCSSEYAQFKAAAVGDKYDISPLRTSEITREAVETIQRKQRDATKGFLLEAPRYVERYVKQFTSAPVSSWRRNENGN